MAEHGSPRIHLAAQDAVCATSFAARGESDTSQPRYVTSPVWVEWSEILRESHDRT